VKNYELTVIIKSGKVEEGKKALHDILAKFEATIVSEEDWGLRRLAYEIQELKEAFYWFGNLQLKADAIAKINAQMRLNSSFLRHMFVVIEKPAKTA
jgi:small subunit ribosomal protein S6